MTIDLRELAKSLMFAEKAKEEAEALKRDNEERDHYKSRYEKIREILLPLWDDKQ